MLYASLSFINETAYQTMLNNLDEGDYLVIGFGHNDEKINDLSRYTDPFGEYQDNLLYFARSIEAVY